jgi:leucyl aminopeptidase
MKTQRTPQIQIVSDIPELKKQTALAICVTEDGKVSSRLPEDDRFAALLDMVKDGEFKGKEGETLSLNVASSDGASTLVFLVGCGPGSDIRSATLRDATATAVRLARERHVIELVVLLPDTESDRLAARFAAQGAVLGLYENDFYKKPDEESVELERVSFPFNSDYAESAADVRWGMVTGESMNWARTLADEPGGSLPPREFARRAHEMAEEFGLKVETLGADVIRNRGMGGLWGVGKGSDEEPALIVLRYEPVDATDEELWAFVGKGITFDTGGISIKPAQGMEEMKSDMAGGAAVLGALRAIAQLKPRQRIVGIVPSAENMPSGRALKPGDVIKTLAGFTIEAVDTDAEGRLVLVDGIAYAKELGAKRIVDLATLTGSIIVALGDFYTGLFSNNDEWADHVRQAAAAAGERVWRMPVSDDYKKLIESAIADFKNYGGRPDATGAALLLSKFAGETPWVHLDIAATAWANNASPSGPKGATGAGIPTLVELACAKEATPLVI